METMYTAIVIALLMELRIAVSRMNKRMDRFAGRISLLESSGVHVALPRIIGAGLILAALVSCGGAISPREVITHAPTIAHSTGYEVVSSLTPYLVGLAMVSLVCSVVAFVVTRSPLVGSICLGELAAIVVLITLKLFIWLAAVTALAFAARWLYKNHSRLKV